MAGSRDRVIFVGFCKIWRWKCQAIDPFEAEWPKAPFFKRNLLLSQPEQSCQIATLNDALRTNINGGKLVLTTGIQALPEEVLVGILHAVRTFNAFTPDNDPYGEHDFGALTVQGYRIIWKIDYYDLSMECHSADPADPQVTQRVLTIMLAEDY